MLVKHLGQVVDIDPALAAVENKILETLGKGPKKRITVYLATRRSCRFSEALESLVGRGLVVRETTARKNSFLLRLAKEGLE
jgi:hypothetical protein